MELELSNAELVFLYGTLKKRVRKIRSYQTCIHGQIRHKALQKHY